MPSLTYHFKIIKQHFHSLFNYPKTPEDVVRDEENEGDVEFATMMMEVQHDMITTTLCDDYFKSISNMKSEWFCLATDDASQNGKFRNELTIFSLRCKYSQILLLFFCQLLDRLVLSIDYL